MTRIKFVLFAAVLILAPTTGIAKNPVDNSKEPLLIMAASSLTNVLPEVAKAWKTHGGTEVTFNFEATSRLAQQIMSGAPGDVFFSADREWMDNLEAKGKLDKKTRATLLSNSIVLVVPADSVFVPQSPKDLTDTRLKHLALAGETVPAGKFGQAALKSEGLLSQLQDRIVSAENVRAALQWVAKKEAEAGIVFQTDARVEPRVKVAFVFPASSHPKIEYPAAIIHGSKNAKDASHFLEFCKTKEAGDVFRAAGFIVLVK